MCAVSAEYFFLCVLCLWLTGVWELGRATNPSMSASLFTSLKHLMLTKRKLPTFPGERFLNEKTTFCVWGC